MFTSAKKYIFCLVLVALCACQSEAEKISIDDQTFSVAYAVTAEEKQKGLMFVETMPDDQGMVFLYEKEAILKFWMKNTLIPLDILFFDKDMHLVHREINVQPHDLTPRGPDIPVCVVVELNGGSADRKNIQLGDILSLNRAYKCLHSS